jgi:hypothetical protein
VDLVALSSIVLSLLGSSTFIIFFYVWRVRGEASSTNFATEGPRSGPAPIMSGQHGKSKMAPSQQSSLLSQQATYVFYLIAAYYIVKSAYRIRMVAIDEFGPVIHEFDPYFNFRATEVRVYDEIHPKKRKRIIRCSGRLHSLARCGSFHPFLSLSTPHK